MGRNWAITIGINGYRNLQRLNYAKRDAEAIQSFLQQELGIQTVYHFTDDSPAIPQDYGPALESYPTYATLRRFFRIRFENPFLGPGDNLWFFFAGHGKRYDDRDYLMPIDADPGDEAEKSTWIPLSYITDRLRRSGADNVMMLIDACRSGRGRRDDAGFGQEKQQGVITLFACSPWESSYEIDELQQGAFTYALLQGLKMEGDSNCATLERLYRHLQQAVPQITQQYKQDKQTPYGVVEPLTKYHLVLLPHKTYLNDIEALKGAALRAEVQRDLELAKQLWTRVLDVSSIDSEAIEAIGRLANVSANSFLSQVTSGSTKNDRQYNDNSNSLLLPASIYPLLTFTFEVTSVEAGSKEVRNKQGKARYFVENLGHGVTLEMIEIPGDTYLMGETEVEAGGQSRAIPKHMVTVSSFFLSKYPITQAQWRLVASTHQVKRELDPDPSYFRGNSRPVEQVSWLDALEFCSRLSQITKRNYRLPSEAEWEYACRSGRETPYHFGETIISNLVNCDSHQRDSLRIRDVFRGQTNSVGSLENANSFGLYDIHGNVWEWCADHWHDNYDQAPSDGRAWMGSEHEHRRVIRGGSWFDSKQSCRTTYRNWAREDSKDNHIGFRVVHISI